MQHIENDSFSVSSNKSKVLDIVKETLPLLIITALYLFTRMFTWSDSFVDGVFIYKTPETGEYIRKATMYMHNFPYLPPRDYYIGYPVGSPLIWPPLFAYCIAVIAIILGGINKVTLACSFIQPIFGAINLVLTYFLVKKIFGRTTALFSAASLIFISAELATSMAGTADHHIGEVLMVTLLTYAICNLKDTGKKGIFVLVVANLVSMFIWRGAPMLWSVGYASMFAYLFTKKDSDVVENFGIASILSAACIGLCSLTGFMGGNNVFSFNMVGWFHFSIQMAAGLFFYTLGNTRKHKIILVSVIIIGLSAFMLTHISLLTEFTKAFTVVGNPDAWIKSLPAYKSIFVNDATNGLNIARPFVCLTIFYFLSPYGIYLIYKICKNNGRTYEGLILSVLFIILLIFPAIRMRYVYWASLPISLVSGVIFAQEWIKNRTTWQRYTSILLLVLVNTIPICLYVLRVVAEERITDEMVKEKAAYVWLSKSTPKTSNYLTPWIRPEYGVLAEWDSSSHITEIGQRAAVGTVYGWEIYGLYPATMIHVTDEKDTFIRILDDTNSKFVIFKRNANSENRFKTNADIANFESSKSSASYGKPAKDLKSTIYYKLMNAKSDEVKNIIPVLRLVYESTSKHGELIRIFERG